jgi:hypothetical protein
MDNSEKIALEELSNQLPYYPASESCQPLDSVVPKTLAIEQKNFALQLKEIYEKDGGVAKFVMDRLQYKDIDSFCRAFSKEQIDAIATAIYNFENRGFGLIVADQTGLGKGRVIAGLIRYSIVHLKTKPTFFTIDKALFSDIYRDLIDIELEANIPTYVFGKYEKVDVDSMTDEEIEEIIREDIDDSNVKISYDFDQDEYNSLEDAIDDDPEILKDVIDQYREYIRENGVQTPAQQLSQKEIGKKIEEASKQGLRRVIPFASQPFTISTGEGILYKRKANEIQDAIRKNKIPMECDLLLMTYSQLRTGMKDGVKTDKLKMIETFVNDGVIILDESHKGAGNASMTGQVLKTLLRNASHVAYVSATYSKREDNMPFYTIATAMKEAMLTDYQLIEAFNNGDVALKEAVSAELVKIGQLVRRERKFEGETFYQEESESSNLGIEQIHKLNQTSLIWNAIIKFQQGYFKKLTSISKDFQLAYMGSFEASSIKKTRSIKAQTFNLFNYFLLAIKVKQSADKIVEELENGRKVVVSLANTLESAFGNLKKDYFNNEGYQVGDVMPNDFNQVLLYLLAESLKFNFDGYEVSDTGKKIRKKQLISLLQIPKNAKGMRYEFAREVYNQISTEFIELADNIRNNQFNVPLSPIDEIIVRVSDKGFKIKEVTGRTKQLKFVKNNEGRYNFREGIIEKRTDKDKLTLVKEFNENKVDALIINQSSATGVSMHSLPTLVNKKAVPPVDKLPQKNQDGTYYVPTSLEPRNEVKARTMIIVQMELDVNTEVQKLGRVNRTGQIFPPNYYYIISCIPAEKRLQAIMKKKLSSLMSLTSGGQNQGDDLFTADDFFSKDAIEPYNDALKDAQEMATSKDVDLFAETAKNKSDIEKQTKAFYFIDFDVQKEFFDKFAENLRVRIDFLKKNNLYDGAVEFQDYRSKTNSIVPYLVCNDNAYTEFGRHVFAEWNTIKIEKEKYLDREVKGELDTKVSIDINLSLIDKKYKEYVEELKNQKTQSETDKKEYESRIKELTEKLKTLPNGEQLEKLNQEKSEKEGLLNDVKQKVKIKLDNDEFDEEKTLLENQQQQYSKELKSINDKIFEITNGEGVSFYLQTIRSINRDVNYFQERIQNLEDKLVQKEEDLEKRKLIAENAKKLISQIGYVFESKQYHEKVINTFDADGNAIIEGYEYNLEVTEKAVLVRVAVYDLIPSGVVAYYVFASKKNSYPISQTTPLSYNSKEIELGKKPIFEFENLNVKFDKDDYWIKYVKDVDTSRFEQVIFLSGNVLKAKAFQSLLSSSGKIVKYNTFDNKLRIGIQTKDTDFAKFNENVNYSLLMTLSEDNFNRILLPLIVSTINFEKVYLEMFFDKSTTLLFLYYTNELRDLINSELNKYSIDVDRSQFADETEYELAVEEAKNKNVQKVVDTIKNNVGGLNIMDKVQIGFASDGEPIIAIFNETLKNIGSINTITDAQLQDYDGLAHKVYNVKQVKYKGGRRKEEFETPKLIDEAEIQNYDGIITPNIFRDNELLIKKSNVWTQNFVYNPSFAIVMTTTSFVSLINYFEKVENLQMVCACNKLALDLAQPNYVFNMASSSMGEIDNLIGERVDNVGSRAITSIENILDELVKILA